MDKTHVKMLVIETTGSPLSVACFEGGRPVARSTAPSRWCLIRDRTRAGADDDTRAIVITELDRY